MRYKLIATELRNVNSNAEHLLFLRFLVYFLKYFPIRNRVSYFPDQFFKDSRTPIN